MKGVVYRGPRDVRVEDVPDAKIDWPTDVLVRITSTNICGSDLHMYEGRTDLEPGMVIGHENLGQVIEVGERGQADQEGRLGLHALQRRLRLLPQLRARLHRLLPQP